MRFTVANSARRGGYPRVEAVSVKMFALLAQPHRKGTEVKCLQRRAKRRRATSSMRRASEQTTAMRIMRLILAAAGLGSLACLSAMAQNNGPLQAPRQPSQQTGQAPAPLIATPRQDRHDGLSISVDPYNEPGRAKEKFGKANPLAVGILPIEVSMHNDTDRPIRVDLSTIQLEVHFSEDRHQQLDWLPPQQVANQVAHPKGTPAPQARRFPIGIPSGADSKADKLAEMLKPLSLDADIVPPKGAIHGFLFFDLNHNMSLVATASLYVPDVTTVPPSKPMMFFEVPLGE